MPENAAETSQALKDFLESIATILPEAKKEIANAPDLKTLEEVKIKFTGKKGELSKFNRLMGQMSGEEKPLAGKEMNERKGEILRLLGERQTQLEEIEMERRIAAEKLDVTLPGIRTPRGSLHPITKTANEIAEIFSQLGFSIESGPEIEGEWMNFDALNMPGDHPARDMQDTFYTERGYVLRTHTSPTQLRSMLKLGAPLAVVTPGRVYRHDSDATHSPMFHQMEGLMIDRDVSFAHLKGVLHEFLAQLIGPQVQIRFRPSFFPFTEPSAEVDIWHEGRGDWMEVLGSGMVHPNVLRNANIDPEEFNGFAFGLGIDRITAVKYGISDIRQFFENDIRFLRQF